MGKSSEIDLVLLRSGRTDWDDAGRIQGRTDLPMSESGRTALRALIRHMAGAEGELSMATVFHGPDEASAETAAMLAGQAGAKTRAVTALHAMELGLWEGLRDAELLDRYPTAYRAWRQDPALVNPPEGETLADAEARLFQAINRAMAKVNGRRVALVLRPVEYALVRCRLEGRPTSSLWQTLEDGPSWVALNAARERIASLAEGMPAQP